ncbi:MAG TPA: response regulator [Oligoflexus sp.]|uniref:response regulator n=1 Tax=Oligoflexus sp. TaxID=1971216 RepID=UPI002D7F675F|nr:response regulator [Oligoflexus sp.]HET9236765.1 response regulator [Oligoflexus sp.]
MRKTAKFKGYPEHSNVTMMEKDEEGREVPNIKGLRVLVVDDDGDTAFILARMLIHEGAQVKWAASVAEAFDLMEAFRPHLILSDLSMPEEDGFDLIRKFRKAQASGAEGFVPAIAISAYSSPEAMQRSFEEGYQAFFPKPVKSQYLIEAVAKLAMVQKTLAVPKMQPAFALKRVF